MHVSLTIGSTELQERSPSSILLGGGGGGPVKAIGRACNGQALPFVESLETRRQAVRFVSTSELMAGGPVNKLSNYRFLSGASSSMSPPPPYTSVT